MKKSKKRFVYIGGSLALIILLVISIWGYYKHLTDVDSSATKNKKAIQYENNLQEFLASCF